MADEVGPSDSRATFCEKVFQLCQPSAALGPTAITECRRLFRSITGVLQERWTSLLTSAVRDRRPILYVYGSDGWSTKLSECHAFKIGSRTIRREGRVRAEFLLEKTILKTIDDELRVSMAMRYSVPRSLTDGKLGWHMFQAAVEHDDYIRLKAPTGICIQWYLQDGLHHAGLARRLHARSEMFYDSAAAEGEAMEEPLAKEMDWTLSWLCTSHVTSNAVKWGMSRHSSEQVHEDIHIGILALRNSSEELLKVVDRFVATRVIYEQDGSDLQTQRELWLWLGVEEQVLREVLFVNPKWLPDRQYLSVSSELRGNPERHKLIASVVVYFLRWRSFSETRWAGVVPAARLLIASWLIGVQYLVKMVYSDDSLSTYYLGGWKRLLGMPLLYLAIAALAMRPAHVFSLAMLEDDRFLKRAAELRDLVEDEARKVTEISLAVWELLIRAIGWKSMDGPDLRDQALYAMCTSIGYLHMHCYDLLSSYPFSLTQGSIPDNVEQLRRRAPVDDPVTRKSQLCLSLGVPTSVIIKALYLIRDAPCSTGLVEKGHAAAALLRRQHARYGTPLILVQATVIQTCPLFRKPKPTDATAERLRLAIRRAQALPVRLTPQNMFCSRLCEDVVSGRDLTIEESKQLRREVFARHNALFMELSADEKNEYRRAASMEVRRRTLQRDADIEALREKLREHLDAQMDLPIDECPGVPNEVNSVRFSDSEIDQVMSTFNADSAQEPDGDAGVLDGLGPSGPPLLPPLEIRAAIEEKAKQLAEPTPAVPWWLAQLVGNRDYFVGRALAEQPDEDSEDLVPGVIFVMVLAMHGPLRAIFLKFYRLPVCYPAPDERSVQGESWRADEYEHKWEMMNAYDLPFDQDSEIVVFGDLVWRGGALRSICEPEPLEVVLAGLPGSIATQPAAKKSRRERDPITAQVRQKILEQWPWLKPEEVDKALINNDEGTSRAVSSSRPNPLEGEVVDQLVGEAMDRLAELRAKYEFEDDDDPEVSFFYYRIQGGKWTAQHRGQFRDGVACYARSSAKPWCDMFGWPKQKGFATNKYGERACVELCREWTRKGNYLCDLWWQSGCDPNYQYDDSDARYTETIEWVDWCLLQDATSDLFSKIAEVRNFWPKRTSGISC